MRRGNAKSELGEYFEAISDYDQASRINPNDARIYNNRGFAKIRLGHPEAAIRDYDEAIRIDPEYTIARTNRENTEKELRELQKQT